MIDDDLTALLLETATSCIICSSECLNNINNVRNNLQDQKKIVIERELANLVLIGYDLIKHGEQSFINYEIQDDKNCCIWYTSGTTSKPKGVILSHKNLSTDAAASIKNVYFGGTSILVLPLYHTFSFTASVLCVMLSGKTVAINKDLKDLRKDIERYLPQNLILVPMIIESLYKQIWIQAKKAKKDGMLRKLITISNLLLKNGIDLRRVLFSRVHKSFGGNLDFIISGGAHIQDNYVKKFQELGIQILNGYGITECSPVLAVNRNFYFKDHSVGQILDGIDIKICDNEIFVKGDVVTAGYYKDELQTSIAFQDGWFKTGDLGYIDEDGFLYITGRKKNLIILSNGKNISPEELEEHLYKLEYIKEVLVYQRDDKIEAEVYLGTENLDLYRVQAEQDLKLINSQLPTYKNISKLIFSLDYSSSSF